MKYIKLFESFDFGYDIPMANSPIKEKWNRFKDIIQDRLIDLDDKGFHIEVNNRRYFSANLIVVNISLSNKMKNWISYDIKDIKDDLIALTSDIEKEKFILHNYTIHSSTDFRSYTFDVKTYGGINDIEHTLEFLGTEINKIELVFGG